MRITAPGRAASGGRLLGAVALCAAGAVATAQEAGRAGQERPGEPVLRFGLDTSLRAGEVAFGETGLLSETDLSARFSTATRTRRLEFGVSGTLRAGAGVEGFDLVGPDVDLSYEQDWARGGLSVDASITRRDLGFSERILDPGDPESLADFALDPDAFDLRSGVQTTRRLSFSFSALEDMPVGLEVDGSLRQVDYPDGAAGVEDATAVSFGIAAPLKLTPRATARVGLSYDLSEAETRTRVRRVFASVRHEASERLTLEAEIGLSRGRTERAGGAVSDQDGLSGSLSAEYEMPRGSIGASASRRIDGDAVRDRLEVTRALDLPGGDALTFGAGIARAGDTVALTGSLGLTRLLSRGSVSASLERELVAAADGESAVSTDVDVAFGYELTRLTSLDLSARYRAVEEEDGETGSSGNLSATLSRQLTRDWALRGGAQAVFRDDDARAEIFVGLSRSFEVRP